jgi:LysR family nitrogen assimilation transcriptional regulator
MELRQLNYFARIVEQGSFRRAAISLHIAQPALSQQISKLELELGTKLLVRSIRGVIPTDAGSAFYKQAKSIIKQIGAIKHMVNNLDGSPSGSVSLGLATSTATILGPPFISAMRKRLPSIQMEFTTSPSAHLSEMAINGRIDVSILFVKPPIKGLNIQKLLVESLFLIGPRGSLKTDKDITLREAGGYPLMLPSAPNTLRNLVDTAFKEHGIAYVLQSEINATYILKKTILQGLGYSIMPWAAISDIAEQNLIDARKVIEPELFREASICVSDVVPKSYATECVCELLIETIHDLAARGIWRNIVLV